MNTFQVKRSDQLPEFEHHKFVIEASTLGLAPGEWCRLINTDMGNGQPFVLSHSLPDGCRVYQQALGCLSLHVLND